MLRQCVALRNRSVVVDVQHQPTACQVAPLTFSGGAHADSAHMDVCTCRGNGFCAHPKCWISRSSIWLHINGRSNVERLSAIEQTQASVTFVNEEFTLGRCT